MNCHDARRLFGACWDDELTLAEREWLEAHLAACRACRAEYDTLARTLEMVGTLPRVEAAPELSERVMARIHRSVAAADRVPVSTHRWVPAVAAAAAVLVIAGLLLAPWAGVSRAPLRAPVAALEPAPRQPELRTPAAATPSQAPGTGAAVAVRANPGAGVPDSLFDHSEDVELVLDPVTLHHGRASLARSRATTPVQGEQAVISF